MMERSLYVLILIGMLAACGEKAKNEVCDCVAPTPCIDHLKGHTFELYRLDTQSFRMADDKAAGQLGSMMIDSNSSLYRTYIYNQNGDSLTVKESLHSSTRTFAIHKDTAFWGDDMTIIQTCSETDYKGWSYNSSKIPDAYLKVIGYTKRIK